MSAQVQNNQYANIGRMFARQSVPGAYAFQKQSGNPEPDAAAAEQVDSVLLSPFAPRPLNAGFLRDAVDTGRVLGEGGRLTSDRVERLREDRIFNAVSALAALGTDDENGMPSAWPGGLPAPTREEMEVARRRLSQRLRNLDEVANPEQAQQDRIALLQKLNNRDFSALAGGREEEAAATAAMS